MRSHIKSADAINRTFSLGIFCSTPALKNLALVPLVAGLALVLLVFLGCGSDKDDQAERSCDDTDSENIIAHWGNPRFITNASNCFQEECLDLSFELHADASYRLHYSIYDPQSNTLIRTQQEQGDFVFNCGEVGRLGGRYSFLRYMKGQLVLQPDSLPPREWNVEWNGLEGLIIYPEYLGFTHKAYVKLERI